MLSGVEILRFQLNGKYFKNGKTSVILVWVSQERWWRTNTLLSFYQTFKIFGHIINYLLTSLVRSELVKYRISVFLHGPRLAALAHLHCNRNSNCNSKPSCNPNYYMEQATSSEIAHSDWLKHVMCRSVSFRIGPVRILSAILVTKEQRKETLKNREN